MEAVRAVVDRLQSFAPQPPRGLALGGGLRPGAGAAGRGAAVPTAAQPLPRLHRPQGHQLQAADVPGRKGGGSGFRGALCGVGAKVRGTRGWGGFVPMSASPPRLPHRGAQPLRGDNGNGLGGNPSPGMKETSPPYLHHPETKATNSAEGCVITFRALNESLIRL